MGGTPPILEMRTVLLKVFFYVYFFTFFLSPCVLYSLVFLFSSFSLFSCYSSFVSFVSFCFLCLISKKRVYNSWGRGCLLFKRQWISVF